MGNFYPMMATSLFAVFWLSFGMLQLPTLGLAAFYSSDGMSASEGATTAEYNSVIGLFLIVWGFAFLTFLLFALKTNMVFSAIFLVATAAVWVLSAAYFKVAQKDYVTAGELQKVSFGDLSSSLLLSHVLTAINRSAEHFYLLSRSWGGGLLLR
jgi:succinate-acetate transporter protein